MWPLELIHLKCVRPGLWSPAAQRHTAYLRSAHAKCLFNKIKINISASNCISRTLITLGSSGDGDSDR